ncbi:MAG TPA: hypothetical protein VGI67_14225 [Thermoleophilaceae bacterium]|jgi:hypothetical protein
MNEINVLVVSAEEADHGVAEFWCDGELIGVTCLNDGRLQLRIESRADGDPWRLDTTSLATGLAQATRLIASY